MTYVPRLLSRILAFLLIFTTLVLGQNQSVNKNPSLVQSDDEDLVRSVVRQIFMAYEKKDITAITANWSSKSPHFTSYKEGLKTFFAGNENIKVEKIVFNKINVNGEKANVRVFVELSTVESENNKPSQTYRSNNRFLALIKEEGRWKIFREMPAEKELALRLAEAKNKEEQNQILNQEKELINNYLVIALREEGNRLWGQAPNEQVFDLYSLALSIAEKIGNKEEMSFNLNSLGVILMDMGKMSESLEAYQKALKISEENQDKATSALVLSNIGNLNSRKNQFDQALDYLQKAFKLAEEVNDKSLMVSALKQIGTVFVLQSEYAKSLEYQLRALKLAQENGIEEYSILNGIGVIYAYQNDYNKALEYWEKSVKLQESPGGYKGSKSSTSIVLMNIGNVYDIKGDKTKAMMFYHKSLKLGEEIGDTYAITSLSVNIGSTYWSQGNYEQALINFNKAVSLAESSEDKINLINAYNGISDVFHDQDKFIQALEYSKKALALAEEISYKPMIAASLKRIGSIYFSLKDFNLALEYFQKALRQSESIGENEQTSYIYMAIAKMQIAQKNISEALKTMESAKKSFEKITGSTEHSFYYKTLAEAYIGLNQIDKARPAIDKSITIIESIRNNAAGDENEKQLFFEKKVEPYYMMIELLAAENNPNEAFVYAERAKSRALLDVLQNGKINVTKAMTVQEHEQEQLYKNELFSLNAQISKLNKSQAPDKNRLIDLQNQLQKKRLEFEDFQTRLYAAHPELKVQRGEIKPVSLEESVKLLPDDKSIILEFVVAEDKTFLFAITKDSAQKPLLKVYPIKFKQKDLAERVESFRSKLAKGDLDFQKSSRELFDLLIKPAQAQITGKTNLIIVPDNVLWDLPFQALQDAQNHYLIEQTALSYAPSLTALREMTKKTKKINSDSALELLAFGNPIIGKETKERVKQVFMSESLEPIPEAERLVASLQKMYGAQKSKVFVGSEAREETAKTESSKYRIVQFATHGILNNSSPMYSHLLLAQNQKNPTEDGLLEAWEMKNLNLNADMVILSACETARGKVSNGEGVIGMSWALFIAGAPTTVVSQWKVESSSTTELMLEFHRQLLSGKNISKAEALRRASLKLMKMPQYKHPSYWAGFVIIGNAS